MKNKKLLIRSTAILIISVAFLFLLIIDPYKNKENDNEIVALLGIKDKIFKSTTKEELLQILETETTAIYLGKIDSNYSRILETLYNSSLTSNINSIYYLDIEEEKTLLSYENNNIVVQKEGSKFYLKLLEKISSFSEIYTLYNKYNEPINSGYNTIYTPMVIFIKQGKILFTHYIDNSSLKEINFNELSEIYKEGFEKIS